ncbi:MAG: hypothetical protein KGS44_11865 [Alphaproteobacteria bacterium]|nr:hypothetical protein [Alphaproteobacteria bacterium]
MRIEGPRPAPSATTAKRADAAAPGFSASGPAAAGKPPSAAAAAPPPSLAALMALQGDEAFADAPARRRRQVDRAAKTLDALDRVAVGLLEGRLPGGLRQDLLALRDGAERTGDPGLDDLLLEVDIRAAVELAKLEREALLKA